MTTYLLLALTDDGGYAEAYEYERSELLNFLDKRPERPTLSVNDRTAATYEVSGWLIDVRRKEPSDG